jgi:hypothetical protein
VNAEARGDLLVQLTAKVHLMTGLEREGAIGVPPQFPDSGPRRAG